MTTDTEERQIALRALSVAYAGLSAWQGEWALPGEPEWDVYEAILDAHRDALGFTQDDVDQVYVPHLSD